MIYIFIFIIGLCFGSFVNALVYRLHENARHKKQLSVWSGRSICPNCKHKLTTLDLVPVISWLLLKGRCRYCNKPISNQYPLVELFTAFLFVGSYIFWPYNFDNYGVVNFLFWLIYLVGFMALLVYDFKWMILPDRIVYPLIILSGVQVLVNIFAFNKDFGYANSAILGVLVSSGLFWLLFQISKGKWIGGGDVKLGIVLGLILADPIAALLMLLIASILGILAIIPDVLKGKFKSNKQIPFGPFLIIATIIVYIFGNSLINWYKTQFLII